MENRFQSPKVWIKVVIHDFFRFWLYVSQCLTIVGCMIEYESQRIVSFQELEVRNVMGGAWNNVKGS